MPLFQCHREGACLFASFVLALLGASQLISRTSLADCRERPDDVNINHICILSYYLNAICASSQRLSNLPEGTVPGKWDAFSCLLRVSDCFPPMGQRLQQKCGNKAGDNQVSPLLLTQAVRSECSGGLQNITPTHESGSSGTSGNCWVSLTTFLQCWRFLRSLVRSPSLIASILITNSCKEVGFGRAREHVWCISSCDVVVHHKREREIPPCLYTWGRWS